MLLSKKKRFPGANFQLQYQALVGQEPRLECITSLPPKKLIKNLLPADLSKTKVQWSAAGSSKSLLPWLSWDLPQWQVHHPTSQSMVMPFFLQTPSKESTEKFWTLKKTIVFFCKLIVILIIDWSSPFSKLSSFLLNSWVLFFGGSPVILSLSDCTPAISESKKHEIHRPYMC